MSLQKELRDQTFQQLREHLPGETSAKMLLAALLVFLYVGSWNLDAQDAYWEDPQKKTDSPWTGSGDATQVVQWVDTWKRTASVNTGSSI